MRRGAPQRSRSPTRLAAAAALIAAALIGLAPVEASGHGAKRSMRPGPMPPGGELTVTIEGRDFGPFARISETLPEGWEYTGSSLPEEAVSVEDRIVRFIVFDEPYGDGTFTYTLRAPLRAGAYAFSGIIEDARRVAADIEGASEIAVVPGAGEEGEVCLRGPVHPGGFSLVITTVAVDDLDACASGLGIAALYALRNGEYAVWIPGAAESENLPFRELFPEGLPPLTPLFVEWRETPEAVAAAADARLAWLELAGVRFGPFSPGRTEYAGMAVDGRAQATVRAVANHQDALILFGSDDADGELANGHQLPLDAGRPISVSVTSADQSRTSVYRVWINVDPQEGDEPEATCLRGDIDARLNLLVYAGGAIEDLAACARSLGVGALYAFVHGGYVPYFLDAPDFVNARFRALHPYGLAPATPLVVVVSAD